MTKYIAFIFIIIATLTTRALSGGDTALTYQGRLLDAGEPANGTFNIDFSLWDDPAAGSQIGLTVIYKGLSITDGLFTAELDFGADAFDNNDRWLEIMINGVPLAPRQPITRSPYSIQTRGIYVNENQRVGIGTTIPLVPLHVTTDAVGVDAILAFSEHASGVIGRTDSANGSGVFGRHDPTNNVGLMGTSEYGVYGRAIDLNNHWAGYFNGRTHVTDTLFIGREEPITSSEYFGLNAPVGDLAFGGMYISTNTNDGKPFYGYAPGGIVGAYHYYNGSTEKWHLHNGIDRLTVQSNGNIGIGTTSPTETLHVVSVGFSAIEAHNTSTSGVSNAVWGVNDSPDGRGLYGLVTAFSGQPIGVKGESFSVNGFDFFAAGAGTDYGSSSSIRWKNNVRNIDQPLEMVAQLRGVYFDWDKDHGGHHDVGMIAEEVGAVLPEIVNYEENGIDAIGMDYSKLTPLLVEALNELNNEVQHKDLQITELQARLTALETLVEQLALQQNGGAK